MSQTREYQRIYDEAFDYLQEFDGVNEDLIVEHLHDWDEKKPNSLQELYRSLLFECINRQGWPNILPEFNDMQEQLCDFSPDAILSQYDSNEEFLKNIEKSDGEKLPEEIDFENSSGVWVQFSKSVLSVAEFLIEFENIDEFERFVDGEFLDQLDSVEQNNGTVPNDRPSRHKLPILLEENIHGLGFATACNLLKENGYPEFVKPDTHIRDLFTGLGLSNAEEDDIQLFYDVLEFADTIDEVPYKVDKLFWIVGSGRFPQAEPDDGEEIKIATDKQEFINQVKEEKAS